MLDNTYCVKVLTKKYNKNQWGFNRKVILRVKQDQSLDFGSNWVYWIDNLDQSIP